MSFNLDLKEHGPRLQQLYEQVLASDPSVTYAIFEYDPSTNCLVPGPSGGGGLAEFVEEFDDSLLEYGFARVEVNGVNKIVFVGWIGENVSSKLRLLFNSHAALVAKQFPRHHVQITARASDELTPQIILEKLNNAAGSKYALNAKPSIATKPKYVVASEGADEKDWGSAKPVEQRDLGVSGGSGYKSSVRDELASLKLKQQAKPSEADESEAAPAPSVRPKAAPAPPAKEQLSSEAEALKDAELKHKPKDEPASTHEDADKPQTSIQGLDSSSSYKPVGKIDLKKIREEGRNSKFADARIEKIEPSYKPVGKIDLKKIREQARREKEAASARLHAKAEEFEAKAEAKSEELKAKSEEVKRDIKEGWVEVEKEVERETAQVKEQVQKQAHDAHERGVKKAHELHEEEEEHLGSLADRIKAFQSSVSSAKPQHDVTSKRAPRAQPAKAAPAAKSEPTAKSTVSGFAARFAKKEATPEPEPEPEQPVPKAQEPKEPEPEEHEEPEEPEPAPAPVPTPARRQPEPEPVHEAEPEPEPRQEAHEPAADALTGTATQSYESQDDDEISFEAGEKIDEIIKTDEHWYIGRNAEGQTGLFPAAYVQLDGEAPAAASDGARQGVALFDYQADADDELSFQKDEVITVLDETSDAWFTGENEKGETGLFPSSYIKFL